MPNSNQAVSAPAGIPIAAQQDELLLRQFLDLLLAGRYTILIVSIAALIVGAMVAAMTAPTYQATGMVQVEEKDSNKTGPDLSALNALTGSAPLVTETELQIIPTRLVLDQVINQLSLQVQVSPRYFPLVGNAYARLIKHSKGPAPAPLGLRKYAWGGEVIEVPVFEVPETKLGTGYVLRATDKGYELLTGSEDHQLVLSGTENIPADAERPEGNFHMVVSKLKARPGTEFTITRLPLAVALKSLTANLTVKEKGKQSGILSITFLGGSPQFVATVVNSIENAYLQQNVERRSTETEHSLEFLEQQLPKLKDRVSAAQQSLNTYQLQHGSIDVTEETKGVLEHNVQLETQRLTLTQQREEALQRFSPGHPTVQAIDDQLGVIDRELGKVKEIEGRLPTTQQNILSLMRDVEVNIQLYSAMLNSYQQLQITKAGTVGNVRVVEYALEPLYAIAPSKRSILLVSFFAGLILGCGVVFVQRAMLRGIDDPRTLESKLGLMTYASIPYSSTQTRLAKVMYGKEVSGNHLLACVEGKDTSIEALRSLRSSLHFAMLEAPNHIVMMTGPSPNIGKSFVCANFGAVLALSGKRVVIIDADMRKGYLNKYVSQPVSPGLSDYVVGDVDIAGILQTTELDTLRIIARGTTPPNPAELLLHERFAKLLKDLSEQFDYVIVDTPPVLPVADATIIGRYAGCTLLVLKSAEHPLREIEETCRRLNAAGIEVKGTIFNQVGRVAGSYGYGGYGYGYGYSSYGEYYGDKG